LLPGIDTANGHCRKAREGSQFGLRGMQMLQERGGPRVSAAKEMKAMPVSRLRVALPPVLAIAIVIALALVLPAAQAMAAEPRIPGYRALSGEAGEAALRRIVKPQSGQDGAGDDQEPGVLDKALQGESEGGKPSVSGMQGFQPLCGDQAGGRIDIPSTQVKDVVAAILGQQPATAGDTAATGREAAFAGICQLLPCMPGCGGEAMCPPETFELLAAFARGGAIPWNRLMVEGPASISLLPNHCLVGQWADGEMPPECAPGYRMVLKRIRMQADVIDELMAK
jgi:hypothetical protein